MNRNGRKDTIRKKTHRKPIKEAKVEKVEETKADRNPVRKVKDAKYVAANGTRRIHVRLLVPLEEKEQKELKDSLLLIQLFLGNPLQTSGKNRILPKL